MFLLTWNRSSDSRQVHHQCPPSLWDSFSNCDSFHTNAFLFWRNMSYICLLQVRIFCTEEIKVNKKKRQNESVCKSLEWGHEYIYFLKILFILIGSNSNS